MSRAPVHRASNLVAALFVLVGGAARGQDARTFIMPDDDGYGVADCLAAGPKSGCGRIVADAWCESKGFAKARTFGREDGRDITGSISSANIASAPAPITITCQN
ncbi:MAG: hypothetical protein ABWZ80_01730 [Beijerinckiaceae bacterium]